MEKATIVGVDLAKNVFQVHGAAAEGAVLMADHPACVVAMEACGGAHYWAREMRQLGHEVRLIAPKYVKPFIKRQKNDAAGAEAIVEAALRPTMRFVEPKTEDQQARSIGVPHARAAREATNRCSELAPLAPSGVRLSSAEGDRLSTPARGDRRRSEYAMVLFTIIVQGLSLQTLVAHVVR